MVVQVVQEGRRAQHLHHHQKKSWKNQQQHRQDKLHTKNPKLVSLSRLTHWRNSILKSHPQNKKGGERKLEKHATPAITHAIYLHFTSQQPIQPFPKNEFRFQDFEFVQTHTSNYFLFLVVYTNVQWICTLTKRPMAAQIPSAKPPKKIHLGQDGIRVAKVSDPIHLLQVPFVRFWTAILIRSMPCTAKKVDVQFKNRPCTSPSVLTQINPQGMQTKTKISNNLMKSVTVFWMTDILPSVPPLCVWFETWKKADFIRIC